MRLKAIVTIHVKCDKHNFKLFFVFFSVSPLVSSIVLFLSLLKPPSSLSTTLSLSPFSPCISHFFIMRALADPSHKCVFLCVIKRLMKSIQMNMNKFINTYTIWNKIIVVVIFLVLISIFLGGKKYNFWNIYKNYIYRGIRDR